MSDRLTFESVQDHLKLEPGELFQSLCLCVRLVHSICHQLSSGACPRRTILYEVVQPVDNA